MVLYAYEVFKKFLASFGAAGFVVVVFLLLSLMVIFEKRSEMLLLVVSRLAVDDSSSEARMSSTSGAACFFCVELVLFFKTPVLVFWLVLDVLVCVDAANSSPPDKSPSVVS